MLTSDQREYILKGRDAETNAEKRKTYDYRIRIKAREAIIDLKFLFEHLPPDQQKQIFLTDESNELLNEIAEKYPPTYIKSINEKYEHVVKMVANLKPLEEAQKIKEEYEKKLKQLPQEKDIITLNDVNKIADEKINEILKSIRLLNLTDEQKESLSKIKP